MTAAAAHARADAAGHAQSRSVGRRFAWVLAALYAAIGLATMALAPKVPYADAWRFLGNFLQQDFPRDILAPDNGHHELLANAVRVLELRWFAAGQWLQIAVGMILLATTLIMVWRSIRPLADARSRAAAMLMAVLGLFWLGNVRALGHGHETVHAYSVTLLLMCGLLVLAAQGEPASATRRALAAAACAMAAAFSFGSGIACFAAFIAVLAMRRAPWRQWAVLIAGMLATLMLLRLGGSRTALELAPLQQLIHLLRWLAGPFLYASWPLFDPALATQIPVAAVRGPVEAGAQAYVSMAGPMMLARWPHVLIGACGLAWLAFASWRARLQPSMAVLTGLGLAWFACAVGAMIALVRLDYLHTHPEQLLAARYVVWSSLFWAGLGIATIARARNSRRALAVVIAVAVLLLPSEYWMSKLGARMAWAAEQGALAAAVGVVDPDLPLGETVPDELTAALPPLRSVRAAVFAWPETLWLGRRVPEDAATLPVSGIEAEAVGNRLGADGRRVRFTLASSPSRRLLLVDGDGVVRGLAMRDSASDGPQWIGSMRGTAPHAKPVVMAMPR